MEWYLLMLLIFGSLLILMLIGIPVAFAFLVLTFIGAFLVWGDSGLEQYVIGIRATLGRTTLLPIPLFILMGEVMFQSGLGIKMMDALDKWLGRLPGRLSLLTVGGGAMLATLTGSGIASTAILGSLLVPEMEKRGYNKTMILGPILGSSGLAIMIPPSGFIIFIAVLAQVSVKGALTAAIVPGILMAILYAAYVVIRSRLQPSLAPSYEVSYTLSEKLRATLIYILPLGGIVFLVTGVIVLGIATPTEAAATGTLGTFILAACYKGLSWQVIKKSVSASVKISTMILIIFTTAAVFSQILAYTQVAKGFVDFALSIPVAPIMVVIMMQLTTLVLGCFMAGIAVAMIAIPLFMPIISTLGFDPLWFIILFMLNLEMAHTTPPFGMYLFVMKSVVGDRYTIGDIALSAFPFLACDLIVMILMLAFPSMVLWLPSLGR